MLRLRLLGEPCTCKTRRHPNRDDRNVLGNDAIVARQVERVNLEGDVVVVPDCPVARINLAPLVAREYRELALVKVGDLATLVDATLSPQAPAHAVDAADLIRIVLKGSRELQKHPSVAL